MAGFLYKFGALDTICLISTCLTFSTTLGNYIFSKKITQIYYILLHFSIYFLISICFNASFFNKVLIDLLECTPKRPLYYLSISSATFYAN